MGITAAQWKQKIFTFIIIIELFPSNQILNQIKTFQTNFSQILFES